MAPLIIGVIVLLIVLAAVVIGGYILWKKLPAADARGTPVNLSVTTPVSVSSASEAAAASEVVVRNRPAYGRPELPDLSLLSPLSQEPPEPAWYPPSEPARELPPSVPAFEPPSVPTFEPPIEQVEQQVATLPTDVELPSLAVGPGPVQLPWAPTDRQREQLPLPQGPIEKDRRRLELQERDRAARTRGSKAHLRAQERQRELQTAQAVQVGRAAAQSRLDARIARQQREARGAATAAPSVDAGWTHLGVVQAPQEPPAAAPAAEPPPARASPPPPAARASPPPPAARAAAPPPPSARAGAAAVVGRSGRGRGNFAVM